MLKRVIALAICLVSVLGINFIPLELLLKRGFSSSGAMLLYLAENVTAIFISTAIVFVLGDRRAVVSESSTEAAVASVAVPPAVAGGGFSRQVRPKQAFADFSPLNAQILNFLVPAVFATAATSVFLFLFVFSILNTKITAAVFWMSVLWIIGFQLIEFTGTLIMIYPLRLKRSESFLNRTLGRVFLLLLCVFLGIFCAAWVNEWFVLPFVVLKTVVDIGEQFQIFRDLGKTTYELTV